MNVKRVVMVDLKLNLKYLYLLNVYKALFIKILGPKLCKKKYDYKTNLCKLLQFFVCFVAYFYSI